MKRLSDSKYFPLIFILISAIFTLIYSWSISPLFLGDGLDSSIFKTIGLGMTQGKMPYTDLFDHKGGILFIIQALGWLIAPGRWGLYLIQVVFMSATLIFLYKTTRIFLDSCKAFGATMASLLLYVVFMESGNQCETYMLPFSSMTLYLAVKYMYEKSDEKHPLKYSLLYGVAFAFAFWIRPNDAVSQIGSVMFGIFLFLLYRKEYKNAILNAMMFLCGCAVITVPVMTYFASKDCLLPLLDGTFLYNIKYVSEDGLPSAQMILVPSFVLGIIIWRAFKEEKRRMNFIFIPMLILTLMLIGKRDYAHYLIIIVPAGAVFFSVLIRNQWKIYLGILILALAIFSVRHHNYIFKSIETRSQIEAFYNQTRRIFSYIPENERTQVWSLNLLTASNDDSPNIFSTLDAMLDSGITPCNKVFVYFHLDTFPDEEKITANLPLWVAADPTRNDFELYESYLSENYTIVDSTDGTCVGDIVLYKRNDADR